MAESETPTASPSTELAEEEDPQEEEEAPAGDPSWLMTFGDCISLLLTFFVLLISFSSFEDPEAVKNIITFDIRRISTGIMPLSGTQFRTRDIEHDDAELARIVAKGGNPLQVPIEMIDAKKIDMKEADKATVTLEQLQKIMGVQKEAPSGSAKKENFFSLGFDPGISFLDKQSLFTGEGVEATTDILPLFADIPNDIVVVGYADDSFGLSPDEEKIARENLALARADQVAQQLIQSGIDPVRISLASGNAVIPETIPEKSYFKKVTISIDGTLDGFYTNLRRKKELS